PARSRVDVFFGSSAAVEVGGAHHPEPEVVTTKQGMIDRATTRVPLVDHTNTGTHALHRISDLRSWDVIITDAGIADRHLDQLRSAATKVIVAPSTSESSG